VKIVLAAFLISTVIYSKQKVQALLWVILGSLAFFGVKGGLFTILTGGAHRVQGPPGSFLDGNTFLGVAMIMGLPLFVAFARNMKNKWWLRASYLSFWLTVLSIVFTYSRGALLGLGTSLRSCSWAQRNCSW
jgi:probable O-glycosylation ligase (exosortase A-associated)